MFAELGYHQLKVIGMQECDYSNGKGKEIIFTKRKTVGLYGIYNWLTLEALQEKYKNLKIEVDYVKIKMYSIKIGTKTIFYEWKDNLTFSANIESIKCYIDLIIGGRQ